MDRELLKFQKDVLENSEQFLKQQYGLADAYDYLEIVSDLPEKKLSELATYAKDLDYSSHFRAFPPLNQDIAMVLRESSISTGTSYYQEGQGYLHSKAASFEEIVRLSATFLPTYLVEQTTFSSDIIDGIRESVSRFDSSSTFEEYVHYTMADEFEQTLSPDAAYVPLDSGFFEDFYYTNVNKFPLPNKDEKIANSIDKGEFLDFSKPLFIREMKKLDPQLIVCCTKPAWEAIVEDGGIKPLTSEKLSLHMVGKKTLLVKSGTGTVQPC